MYVIDNISHKAPKFVYTPPPPLITRYDEDAYWDEEVRRWNEGYNGMTGFYYWYLTQWWLKSTSSAKGIRPDWREDDEDLFFNPMQFAMDNQQDFIAFKRRRAAWSSILSALIVYKALTKTGCQSGYTSADVKRINDFFDQKVNFGVVRLAENLPERIFNFRYDLKNSKSGIILKTWDAKTKDYSLAYGIETVTDTKKLEGYTYNGCVCIDEIAIHGKVSEVWGSADASRLDGFEPIAQVFAGGTAGTVTHENRKALHDLLVDSKVNKNVVTFFLGYHAITKLPKDKTTKDFEEDIPELTINGYTDHKRAKEFILQKRERLWKAENKSAYWNWFYAYPLEESEIFLATNESTLPAEIVEGLQAQQQVLNMNKQDTGKPMTTQGKIQLKDGIPSFDAHSGGRWHILHEPKPNTLYIAGTDPIPFNSTKDKGSSFASIIENYDLNRVDAIYIGRVEDPETIASEVIAGQMWYNNAKNMLETNRGEALYLCYKSWGYSNLLADSPYALGLKFTKQVGGKGYKSEQFTVVGNGYLIDYLRKYPHLIYFEEMIKQALLLGKKDINLDIMDAFKAVRIYHHNIENKQKKANETQSVERTYECVINGQRVQIPYRVATTLL